MLKGIVLLVSLCHQSISFAHCYRQTIPGNRPVTEQPRSLNLVFVHETSKCPAIENRSGRLYPMSKNGWQRSARYCGATPWTTLYLNRNFVCDTFQQQFLIDKAGKNTKRHVLSLKDHWDKDHQDLWRWQKDQWQFCWEWRKIQKSLSSLRRTP